MDRVTAAILAELQKKEKEALLVLGDNPRSEQFEHGIQVGVYRAYGDAIAAVERVLDDADV